MLSRMLTVLGWRMVSIWIIVSTREGICAPRATRPLVVRHEAPIFIEAVEQLVQIFDSINDWGTVVALHQAVVTLVTLDCDAN